MKHLASVLTIRRARKRKNSPRLPNGVVSGTFSFRTGKNTTVSNVSKEAKEFASVSKEGGKWNI